MPLNVYIIEQSSIARFAAAKLNCRKMAVTIGNKIYLHETSKTEFMNNKSWLCHELKHVQQFKQYGFLAFIFKYLWESVRKGYSNNKWEIEARNAENDVSLLETYKIV